MPSRPEPRNNHEDVSGELSEPDWEGFEAFSNDGSDDPEVFRSLFVVFVTFYPFLPIRLCFNPH